MRYVFARCFRKTAVQVCTVITYMNVLSCNSCIHISCCKFLHLGNLIRNIDSVYFPQVKNKPWLPWVYTWIRHHRKQGQCSCKLVKLAHNGTGMKVNSHSCAKGHYSKKEFYVPIPIRCIFCNIVLMLRESWIMWYIKGPAWLRQHPGHAVQGSVEHRPGWCKLFHILFSSLRYVPYFKMYGVWSMNIIRYAQHVQHLQHSQFTLFSECTLLT
jgi:hypothetical protein